jgi:hypothetical protein
MTEEQLQRLAAAYGAKREKDTTMDMIVEMLADVRLSLTRIEHQLMQADQERDCWGHTPAQQAALRKIAADIRKEFGLDAP